METCWDFNNLLVNYTTRVQRLIHLRIESIHYYYTALRKSPAPPVIMMLHPSFSQRPYISIITRELRSRLTCGFGSGHDKARSLHAVCLGRGHPSCAPDADPVGGEGGKKVNIRSTQCAPVEVFSFSLYPLLITLLADPQLRLIL